MLVFALWRHHDAGRLQKESSAPATAATPTASRAYSFAYGQPQHGG